MHFFTSSFGTKGSFQIIFIYPKETKQFLISILNHLPVQKVATPSNWMRIVGAHPTIIMEGWVIHPYKTNVWRAEDLDY
ncbi:MAG: hypothetical protein FWG20_03865 [Candidatus Cloacimonetes bacterium]|nr:hypothetical protein [Candidatus Cloacimonadota bacterium]